MRLDKYLCEMSVGSRSQVKNLIKKGMVSVNGETIKKPEIHIDENKDSVVANGTKIAYHKYRYFMLNKPAGVVSAVTDNVSKTVVDLLNKEDRKDVFPVGRLDKDTEGLLLLTNDGELAHNLLSPGKHVDKKYFAIIDSCVNEEHVESFKNGLDIGEKKLTKPALLNIIETGNNSKVEITITEGKFHQVKRMFGAIGMNVMYLKRISMGKLELDDSLKKGEYRLLTEREIIEIGGRL